MAVIFEIQPNHFQYLRDVYTFFDMISDIGGLQGILFSFVAAFLGIVNYNFLQNYMVSKLFRVERKDLTSQQLKEQDYWERTEFINPWRLSSLKMAAAEFLPACLAKICKIRDEHKYKTFEVGRKRLDKEANLKELIKGRRELLLALKLLLTDK
jgi:hypothetical protein